MRKKMSKVEKAEKEANRVRSQEEKTRKSWGIIVAVISVLLVLAMILPSLSGMF